MRRVYIVVAVAIVAVIAAGWGGYNRGYAAGRADLANEMKAGLREIGARFQRGSMPATRPTQAAP
ncbi:MAG: hypothetical protein QOF78_966 [Phycisphaerales bacterium]|jgi:hypothetical protein|nr:hypothetical protein [Phycisphaerales bacterium]